LGKYVKYSMTNVFYLSIKIIEQLRFITIPLDAFNSFI